MFEVVGYFIEVFAENFLFLALSERKIGIGPQLLLECAFWNLLLVGILGQLVPLLALVVEDTIEFVLDGGVDLWILFKKEIGLLGLH